MKKNQMRELVSALDGSALSKLREAAWAFGPTNPFGDKDVKTGSPSMYRPVGDSCPRTCEFLPRSLARSTVLDMPYVRGLCKLGDVVNEQYGREPGTPAAWLYTHGLGAAVVAAQERLARHGLFMRMSDQKIPGGAITMPFENVPEERAGAGVQLAKCLAQLTDMDCNDCRLCWERMDLCIVFAPHGSQKNKALRVIQDRKETGGCYATGGNVNTHQRRSTAHLGASLRAAAAVMVWAARTDRVARLQVSGDIYKRAA